MTNVRTLFRAKVYVHYSQLYLMSERNVDIPDPVLAFAGQTNGLCGGAIPGRLYLVTGLHTGHAPFAVELYDRPPPIDESWEEIVEVCFTPASQHVGIEGWAGENYWPIDLPQADYRVRYCGSGLDEASRKDTRMDGEPELDRYLLQFWPSPAAPDSVRKQTAGSAAYWHRHARSLPQPP